MSKRTFYVALTLNLRIMSFNILIFCVGSDVMEEHLREIRSLRRRLEDSIQTNDRLRQQLEERLASSARNAGKRLWWNVFTGVLLPTYKRKYIFIIKNHMITLFHQQGEQHPPTSTSRALIPLLSCPMRFEP